MWREFKVQCVVYVRGMKSGSGRGWVLALGGALYTTLMTLDTTIELMFDRLCSNIDVLQRNGFCYLK